MLNIFSTIGRLAEQLPWYLVYLASLSLTATATSWDSSSRVPTATATHSRLATATMPILATGLSPAAAETSFLGMGATFYPLCSRISSLVKAIFFQKPNSWTYNFIEVSGHNLGSSKTWGFFMDFLNGCSFLSDVPFFSFTETVRGCVSLKK
jgi:hypothetical protein